jgi:hypothetical protein
VKRALPVLLAGALLAACGSDDDDGEGDGEWAETAPAAGELARFESPRIGFTFEYPAEFAAERRPREQVLARVGIERGSRLNAIKVRQTAARELGPERYLDEFQRDFERTVGAVEKREERIGELDMGVLEFEDTVDRGGQTVEFTSSSYFFTGAGRTWQVECIADVEHQAAIDAACRTALGSVDFTA